MDAGNLNLVDEIRLFSSTLFYNINLYYHKKKYPGNGEFISCKFYSNYCHAVIFYYLEINDGIFDQVERNYLEIWHNSYLKEYSVSKLKAWLKLSKYPSDMEWYIYFAKLAILSILESIYLRDFIDMCGEDFYKFTEKALTMRVLRADYDISRINCKIIVNAVYKWFETDLVHFATETDIKHGWEERNLTTNALNYLNSTGLHLLSTWRKLDSHKEMNVAKFLDILKQMHEHTAGHETNEATEKIWRFPLNAALLSLHCCLFCNFIEATEIVIDYLNRFTDL